MRTPIVKRTILLTLLCASLVPTLADQNGVQRQPLYSMQVRQQIERSASNPRMLYDVLAQLHRLHLDPQATLACHDLLQRQPNNPYLKSAFAYSWFRTVVPLSMKYTDYQKASPLRNPILSLQAEADRCRREAVKEAPNSPEVLLETGVAECNLIATTSENRIKGTARLRKAVQLDPAWADAHYWLGNCLSLLAGALYTYQKKGDDIDAVTQKIAKEEIASYQKAEELNPKWHTDCLLGYAFAYGWLKEPQKQHGCLEAYIKINPWFLKAPGVAEWRKQISEEARKVSAAPIT